MSYQLQTHYQNKVDLYCRLFSGIYEMNREYFETIVRFVLSAAMLYLVWTGEVGGTIGVLGATLTSGIDLAAVVEAVIKVRTTKRNNRNTNQ